MYRVKRFVAAWVAALMAASVITAAPAGASEADETRAASQVVVAAGLEVESLVAELDASTEVSLGDLVSMAAVSTPDLREAEEVAEDIRAVAARLGELEDISRLSSRQRNEVRRLEREHEKLLERIDRGKVQEVHLARAERLMTTIEDLRRLAPGKANSSSIKIHDLEEEGILAVSDPSRPLESVYRDSVIDSSGELVGEQLGMRPVEEELDVLQADVPEARGFSSTIRVSSGQYGWVSGSTGRVRMVWIKDRVVDTDRSHDYFVYTQYVEADPFARRFAADYVVYDIDSISYISSRSSSHRNVVNEQLQFEHPGTSSGCTTFSLGVSGVGIDVPICGTSSIKGDRFAGKHVEFRNSVNWRGLLREQGKTISTGFSIEVKMRAGTTPYWVDYGDAFFHTPARTTRGEEIAA